MKCRIHPADSKAHIVLKKNGKIKEKTRHDSNILSYMETETVRTDNLMNYTCEANREDINNTMTSEKLTIPIKCK